MSIDGHRVLVVDDNHDIRELIRTILHADGFHIFAASNATEALAILNSNAIELVLLDVMLPGTSGLELLTNIRFGKNIRLNKIPVIMITARTSIEDVDEAIALGATSYIIKPFRASVVREKVLTIFQMQNQGYSGNSPDEKN